MADWKKVIVSGSSAALSALALDTALPVTSGGTGAETLTDGGMLLGSGTGAVTALGQATNGQLVIGRTGADPVLATLTEGANISITSTAGGIEIGASGLGSGTVQTVSGSANAGLNANGLTFASNGNTVNPVLTLGGALANVTNSQLSNSSVTVGSTAIALGASATTIVGLTSVTSTGFTGTLSATSVLADGVVATTQTAGDSSTKVATTAFVAAAATAADLDVVGDGATTTAIDLDSQTLTFKGEDGLQLSASAQTITATIADDSIANAKLANSTISGKELGTDLDNLTVDNDTLTLNTGTTYNGDGARTISIKDGGVDTAAIADSLGTIGVNSFTGSFSGSFSGDVDITLADLSPGDGLSGTAYNGNVARSFSVQKDVATGGSTVPVAVSSNGVGLDLSTIDGTGIGVTTDELSLDIKAIIASNGNNRILTSNGDAANTLTAEPNFTFTGTDLLVTGNERITGNLVVEGTASFQNQENLQVADRFILMASGSATAGDGGIVVQQGTQDVGELFGFDANLTRWAITSSFDASTSTFVPDAFMATAIEGAGADPDATAARYDKKGNIFVGTDQGIWIYS